MARFNDIEKALQRSQSDHHRVACAQAGLLSRRGFAVELAAVKICREAGARVSTNVMVRDLDLAILQASL